MLINDNVSKNDNAPKLEDYRYSTGVATKDTGAYALVQFHPNYTYEDFVGGISPKLDGDKLSYTLKTGAFKSFCDEANKKENEDKKFIFIIDEINRANLSAVFGDEWIVVQALRHGIGIHRGLVPKYIQREIISLFNNGDIAVLLSTTTIT
jgi:5-methylcytosine-specific restriction endonuclease McrBC GTP-binding regulatory subunit McrB